MSRSKRGQRKLVKAASKFGVDGGIDGLMMRNANGKLTPKDLDFLARMKNVSQGKDSYTSEPLKGGSSYLFSNKPNGSAFGKGYTFHTSHTPPKEDGVFHCTESNEITDKCPLNPKIPHILINASVWDGWLRLAEEYDTEWIALLIGKKTKDGDKECYEIERFYFPPQTASRAHVDVPTGVRPKAGTIGAVHSHVGMQVFWSGTDTAHSNWPVEIVINRRREYKALARYQLKCGEWAKGDAKVFVTFNATISNELKKAMDRGKAIEAGRAKVSSSSIVPSIPAGVHAEDREDVSKALLKNQGDVRDDICATCSHSRSLHWDNFQNSMCKLPECKCSQFKAGGKAGTDPWECPLCSQRMIFKCDSKGNRWYCRVCDREYWPAGLNQPTLPSTSTPSTLTVPSETVQGEITQEGIQWPNNSIIPVGHADDPTDFTPEAPTTPSSDDGHEVCLDDYCPKCEGECYVGDVMCDACKGDGLSAEGRKKAAEGMVL